MPAFKAVIALGVLCCPLVFCDDHKEKVNPDPTTNGRHLSIFCEQVSRNDSSGAFNEWTKA